MPNADGLGLHSAEELLRLCDRATGARDNACEIFWTLGAKQVGRAAIQGWRDLLAPAVRAGSISIWPFDGELPVLLASARITVLEAYPAETYGHLGLSRGFGKRVREGRMSQARTILSWCERNDVVLQPELTAHVENGFGDASSGEDIFDAFVGLLGMIEAVSDPTRWAAPEPQKTRLCEIWRAGLSEPIPRLSVNDWHTVEEHVPEARRSRNSGEKQQMPKLLHKTVAINYVRRASRKGFARWPWGWDGHAAHGCPGIPGETPEDRKRNYRERYLR